MPDDLGAVPVSRPGSILLRVGPHAMTTRRRCFRWFGSAISLSLALCGLAGGATFGQSTAADPVSRLEGRYTGTLHAADERFLQWPASGQDKDQKPGTKVELRVSLRPIGERWVLE